MVGAAARPLPAVLYGRGGVAPLTPPPLSEVRADTPVVQIDSFAFSGCTALSEIHIENSEGEPVRGGIGTSAFSGAESLSAYLYVDAAFAWEGKVPEFIVVYVPADVREELLSEWLIGQDQLLALPE